MSKCHGNGSFLVDTCDPNASKNYIFNVDVGDVVVLTACGIPAGYQLTIEHVVGTPSDGCWGLHTSVSGVPATLSSTLTTNMVSVPGTYRVVLDPALPDDTCVYVAAETLSKEDAACIPAPFTRDPVKTLTYVPTGYVSDPECLPLLARVECIAGVEIKPYPLGYIDSNGDFTLSIQITPAGSASKTCETADVLPLLVAGAAGPFTYAELLTQALAAAPVNYATFGAATDTDQVLAVNIAPTTDGGTFTLNGIEVGGVNDPDGVNMANSVEVPDGCEILVSFCVQKCLSKAEIAAL